MTLPRITAACLMLAVASAAAEQAVAQTLPGFGPRAVTPAPRSGLEEKQPLPRGDTVASRSRPEYAPLGVPLGSFLLFPQLGLFQSYNDNVFATEHDTDGDFITNVAPELALQSNWNQHALNFFTGANFSKYADFTKQDYTDYYVATNGRLDILRDSTLFGGASYARRHELPGSPDFRRSATEPTPYDAYNAFARYLQGLGLFNVTLDGAFNRLDYKSVNTVEGPNNSNSEDDRNAYLGGVRVGYQLFPEYEAFVRVNGNAVRYDRSRQTNGRTTDRSSDGYDFATGVALDLGGILFGEAYVGYLQQFYDSNDFNTLGGVNFGGSLTWNVTTLTTVTSRLTRTVETTTFEDSPGVLSTLGEVQVDHELLRNLILNGTFSVVHDDYQDSGRNDNYYIGGIGARYLFNRNIYGSLGYNIIRRSSDDEEDGTNDYTQNVIRIGLEAQL
jgi:hypothetical protein